MTIIDTFAKKVSTSIADFIGKLLFDSKPDTKSFTPTTPLEQAVMSSDISRLPTIYQEAIKKSGTISAPTGKEINPKTATLLQKTKIQAAQDAEKFKPVKELVKSIVRAPIRVVASMAIEGNRPFLPETSSQKAIFGEEPITTGFTPQTPLQKFIFGEEEIKKSSVAYKESKQILESGGFGGASAPIAATAVFGGLVMDLTPFGGSEKKLSEALAKEASENVVKNVLKKANFTDDLIEKYTPVFAKEKSASVIEKELKNIAEASKRLESNIQKVSIPKNIQDIKTDIDAGINVGPKKFAQYKDWEAKTSLEKTKIITEPIGKERKFITSVKEADITAPEVKEGLVSQDNWYIPQANKPLVEEADTMIKTNIDEAIRFAKAPGPATNKSNIVAQKLIVEFQNAGRYKDAIDMVENVAQKATTQGQAIQALSLYNKLTPEGVLKYTQQILDRANVGRKIPLKLTPETAERIVRQAEKVGKMAEGRKKVVETARLIEEIAGEVPASVGKKIATVQTLAQLLNPKTAIRNIVGTGGFMVAENIKDIVATPLDSALSLLTKKRTVTLPNLKSQAKGFITGLAEGVEDAIQRVNTSIVPTQFDLPKTSVFKGKIGGSLETLLNIELRATDRAFYKAAYDGSLYQQLKVTGLKEATEEMKEVAHLDALYRTFQDDNVVSKLFVGIKKALNVGKDFGIGDFVLKYPKTPANLLARGIEYSPGGLVNIVYESIRPVIGKPFRQKNFVDAVSRAIIGTAGLVGTGALLHKLGVITGKPEKDKDIKGIQRISGLGQYKINFSALKRFAFSGLNPDATKLEDGDILVSYDWFQPMAIGLSMGANIDEGGGLKGEAMSIIQSLTEGVNTIQEQPLVSGLRRFMLTSDIASSIESVLEGIPSSFVPTFLSQINQLIDNTQRNSYDPTTYQYAWNLAKAKIPGLAQTLPASIDVFGEDLERYQGNSNNVFNVFFNPSFVSWYKPTPEAEMVLDLMNITGETKQAPKVVGKTYTVNGKSMKLNPKQISALQKYIGTITKELYSSFVADPAFQKLAPYDKIKYLSNILTDIGAAGKIVILGDRPEKPSKDVLKIIQFFNGIK